MDETCNKANAVDFFHYFLTDLSIGKMFCRLINTGSSHYPLQLYKEQVNELMVILAVLLIT